MLPRVCFIVGTTGVGKSQLAIDIASACNGEVINADSMQVYDGLDILTNKVTSAESSGVPHALLGFLQPGQEYHVGDFVRDAQQEVERCLNAGKLPIVAGGTAYYAQNLLFEGGLAQSATRAELLSDPLARLRQNELLFSRASMLSPDLVKLLCITLTLPNTPSPSHLPADFPFDLVPPAFRSPERLANAFYELLTGLDLDMATRWHPRDIRKVRRNVEICLEQGKPASEVVAEQVRDSARYNALVIWLRADASELETRLDHRVDQMVEKGLIDEVSFLHALRKRQGLPEDITSGVFQAIGYREFLGFLEPPCSCMPASSHPALSTVDDKLAHAIERTKISNPCLDRDEVTTIGFDTRQRSSWNQEVRDPALSACQAWLRGDPVHPSAHYNEIGLSTAQREAREKGYILEVCEVCSSSDGHRIHLPPQQMKAHLSSKAHRRLLQSQKSTAPPSPVPSS